MTEHPNLIGRPGPYETWSLITGYFDYRYRIHNDPIHPSSRSPHSPRFVYSCMDYLGKKINVTTAAGYQYEGVLTKVDAESATIELQMVRRTGFNGQPMRDTLVQEYVVFRSDDIVDLYIYQNIPDPAIVSEKPMAQQPLNDHGDWLDPQFPSTKQQKQPQPQQRTANQREIQFGAAQTNQEITFGSVGFSGAVSGVRPQQQHQLSQPKTTQRSDPKPTIQQQQQQQQTVVVNTETFSSKPTSFAAAAAASSSVAPTFTPTSANKQQPTQMQTQKVRSYSTVTKQITQVEGPISTTNEPQTFRPKRREPVIPNSEFDFEQANQRFDKEQLAAEVAPVITTDVPFYQKSSFFDNISSEANASEDRNRTERAWNMETFGQPYVRGSNPRGGYRGQSRGGRGQHQNQRGGHRTIHRNATGSF